MSKYSETLKQIYERNQPYPHTHIQVTDKVILSVHVEVELYRAAHMHEFLKEHAVPFNKVPFNIDFPRLDPNVRCYDNATMLADCFPEELIYCEGIIEFKTPNGIFPLAHGWCCDLEGNIVDPTCSNYQHIAEVNYRGVPIKDEYRHQWFDEVGYNGILDGDYTGKRPGIFVEDKALWYQQLQLANNQIAA